MAAKLVHHLRRSMREMPESLFTHGARALQTARDRADLDTGDAEVVRDTRDLAGSLQRDQLGSSPCHRAEGVIAA